MGARMDKIGSIYLDCQATTPVDSRVYERMKPYFMEEFGNPHSSEHAAGWAATKVVDQAAQEVAGLIGADADEIIFCSGATEANNLAILGSARRTKKRKRILVSSIEHKCVLMAANALKKDGFYVESIPVHGSGEIDLDWLRKEIDEDVFIVSVMAVNNEIGTVQPLEEIGKIVSRYGAFFHCDAAQAPCAIDIDVLESKIDFLSLSGHKIYGPKGIGALYIRRELQDSIEPLIYGGGQQRGLRSGTLPVPLCVGFGTAAVILSDDSVIEERRRIGSMRDQFVLGLQEQLGCCSMNGASVNIRHPGNANLCFEGHVAQDILLALQPKVFASTGSACNTGVVESSYVLRAIGCNEDEARASIRFSLGRFTTEEDVSRTIDLTANVLERFAY
mgnify:CR=1 FL=1